VAGIGDALLSAKYRFHLRQEKGSRRARRWSFGWKAPTGDDDRGAAGGNAPAPLRSAGKRRHGVEIGYATDRDAARRFGMDERLLQARFGRGFRRGDALEVDAAYGRWVVRPNVMGTWASTGVGVHARRRRTIGWRGARRRQRARVAGPALTPSSPGSQPVPPRHSSCPLLKGGDEQETHFNYEIAPVGMFF